MGMRWADSCLRNGTEILVEEEPHSSVYQPADSTLLFKQPSSPHALQLGTSKKDVIRPPPPRHSGHGLLGLENCGK